MRKNNNILLSGCGGYIGSRLAKNLLKEGFKVRGIDKGYFGFDAVPAGVELIKGDIREPKKSWFKNIDAVIHLAAFSNDPTADFSPEANWETNFEGSQSLAIMAKECGVKRFVDASTCSVYYKTGVIPKQVFTEEDVGDCLAGYPKSKRATELMLLGLNDKDFEVVITRKGTVFGQSDRMRYDLIVNTFVKDAFTKGEIKIHAGGKLERPCCSIVRAVDAYTRLTNAPNVEGQIINIVDDNFSIMTVAKKVYDTLLRKRNVQIEMDVWATGTGVIRSYVASKEKMERLLPLLAFETMEDAIVEIWDSLVALEDPEDPIYYNIRNLEQLMYYKTRLEKLGRI